MVPVSSAVPLKALIGDRSTALTIDSSLMACNLLAVYSQSYPARDGRLVAEFDLGVANAEESVNASIDDTAIAPGDGASSGHVRGEGGKDVNVDAVETEASGSCVPSCA